VLGFAFNPLSVYFCRHADGSPAAMIYEVRNTVGERHSYVLPVVKDPPPSGPLRQTARKTFHVSPFLGMDQRYHFRVSDPGERIDLHILQREGDRPILATGFSGMRENLTGKSIGAAFLAVPLMTLKVVAAIFWEAARLWWKGLEVHPHPGRMKAGREAQGRTVP
jgi:DUF1365 family protein